MLDNISELYCELLEIKENTQAYRQAEVRLWKAINAARSEGLTTPEIVDALEWAAMVAEIGGAEIW